MAAPSLAEHWRNPIEREHVYRPHYRTLQEMPGHPWDHALTVRNAARRKAVIAIARHGMRMNLDVIDNAALGHDMDVWLEPGVDYFCCPTKEEHSAHIEVEDIGPRLQIPPEPLERIVHAIKATERDVRCEGDNDAKALCQGDMWSVISENPRDILLGTIGFFREERILKGKPVERRINLEELTAFAAKSHNYLLGFIEEELSLGPWDVDSEGFTMSQRGELNVRLLRPDRFPLAMRKTFPHLLAAA